MQCGIESTDAGTKLALVSSIVKSSDLMIDNYLMTYLIHLRVNMKPFNLMSIVRLLVIISPFSLFFGVRRVALGRVVLAKEPHLGGE